MLIIGIGGGTGSGKTTVVNQIISEFPKGEVQVISQDSYYKDTSHLSFEDRCKINFDHPQSIDFQLLETHLKDLKKGKSINQPVYSFKTERIEGLTGVWTASQNNKPAKKICAMGVRCSRWVTMHGFAFNVNTDLSYFKHIIPCGIDDKAVTSMAQELGKALAMQEVKQKLKLEFVSKSQ